MQQSEHTLMHTYSRQAQPLSRDNISGRAMSYSTGLQHFSQKEPCKALNDVSMQTVEGARLCDRNAP